MQQFGTYLPIHITHNIMYSVYTYTKIYSATFSLSFPLSFLLPSAPYSLPLSLSLSNSSVPCLSSTSLFFFSSDTMLKFFHIFFPSTFYCYCFSSLLGFFLYYLYSCFLQVGRQQVGLQKAFHSILLIELFTIILLRKLQTYIYL